ncbi:MAG: hypothetical protein PUB19_01550 [Lachnospiraceae bacterium]|nr:hypothetical protein [Lachnospiraceae bacterium]
MKSRYERTRKWLLFWCLFIGIGAVAGSTGMLVAPDGSALGMDEMLPYFQVLPLADLLYQDFIFPGIALLIVNGITNLVAAALILAKKKVGIVLGGIFGVTLMLWICIQFVIFPMNFMSTIYFIFGFIQAVTGLIAYISLKQEEFAAEEKKRMEMFGVDATANQDAAPTAKTLVAYFSRMGYTRHYAYEWREKYNADIYEIKATERIEGDLGFWWCGRFGMHHWEMPIEEIDVDLAKYDKVVICSPIWVFALSAPVRSFCAKAKGRIKNAEYVLVHYQKARYENACDEMDSLLGVKHQKAWSICTRQGKEVKRYEL